jgi:hypothetical protein
VDHRSPHTDHIGCHADVIEWADPKGEGIGAAHDSEIAPDSGTYENYSAHAARPMSHPDENENKETYVAVG